MTRPIDVTMLGHLTGDVRIFPFVAVDLSTASGHFRYKTNSGNLTIGGNVYTGDGTLDSVGSLSENRDLSQSNINLVYSGMNAALLAALVANNSNNFPVTIYIGLQDEKNQLIGTPITLGPFLLSAPILELDPVAYKITVSVEYYTIQLAWTNGLLYTDLQQQTRFPGDKFFSLLPTLAAKQMLWGSMPVTTGGTGVGGGVSGGLGGGAGRTAPSSITTTKQK